MKYIERNTIIGVLLGIFLGFAIGAIPITFPLKEDRRIDSSNTTAEFIASSIEYYKCPEGKNLIASFSSARNYVNVVLEGSKVRSIKEFGAAPPEPTNSRRYQTLDGYDPTDFIIDFHPDKAIILLDKTAGIHPDKGTGYVTCPKVP